MDRDLAAELHRRAEADQAARHRMLKTGDGGDLSRIDTDNTTWLKQVVAEHGWPGIALVGEQGAGEAWLLAQHAVHDPAFQRQVLDLLRDAVEAGDALPRHLAYLTDRVLVRSGEPQVYGTQYTSDPDGANLRRHPVTDPDRLDARRARMGLGRPRSTTGTYATTTPGKAPDPHSQAGQRCARTGPASRRRRPSCARFPPVSGRTTLAGSVVRAGFRFGCGILSRVGSCPR
ncbi:hypothetical protein GCM10027168_10360 [Streptomyces capparidis]